MENPDIVLRIEVKETSMGLKWKTDVVDSRIDLILFSTPFKEEVWEQFGIDLDDTEVKKSD